MTTQGSALSYMSTLTGASRPAFIAFRDGFMKMASTPHDAPDTERARELGVVLTLVANQLLLVDDEGQASLNRQATDALVAQAHSETGAILDDEA
jgi:hypothetical protein